MATVNKVLAVAVPDAASVLAALAFPVVVIDGDGRIGYVNGMSEQFFEHSAANLVGQDLARVVPADSPVFSLIRQVRDDRETRVLVTTGTGAAFSISPI